MDSAINLLYWEKLHASERNAMKIATFMGREVRPVCLTKESLSAPHGLKGLLAEGTSLITNAQTLSEICRHEHGGRESLGLIKRLTANAFIYGFEPTEQHGTILRELTIGGFVGIEPIGTGDSAFNVGRDSRDLCRQFAGLSFGKASPDADFTFVEGTRQRDCASAIDIGKNAFFVRVREEGNQLLLVACREIADLDVRVPRDTSILNFFSSVAPLMMFIASASANRCWHNDSPQACFILDDPLLRKRHGFLDYYKLLETMERARFCTSIAFIPWNYNRSDRQLAEVFAAHPERYSLCVHGCDHTRGEFGTTDVAALSEKAHQALERLTQHRELSGVDFDDVMVFPQGIFSTAALEALQSCGYLAAVNTSPYPVDETDGLTLRDLLQVAITRFSNFPLFTRRYPQSLAESAFDLFVGKPALVVEHHRFFRNGYGPLAEVVGKLYGLEERLQWDRLGTICSQACLKKFAEDGTVHVMFFTNRFSLRNETNQPQQYTLTRRTVPEQGVKSIKVNGRPVDIGHEASLVKTRLSLDGGQAADITVEHDQLEPKASGHIDNRVYKAKVFIRRSLSEFRDNYVDTISFPSRPTRKPAGIRPAIRTTEIKPGNYVLITPARDEAAFIRKTLESVAAQTILPLRWVIVSDGSTDGTDDIVKEYAARYDWIELLRMPERKERHFGGKVHAFNAGLDRVKRLPYEVIGNLDGDASFEPDYIEYLLGKFTQNPRLGVAGTNYWESSWEDSIKYDYRFTNSEDVSGLCQLFRRECFEAIGGYQPSKHGGVDLIASIRARMHGWETKSFTGRFAIHHRQQGTADANKFVVEFHNARKDFIFGGHPLWEVLRAVYRLTKKPYVVGGCLIFVGYFWAMLTRAEKTVPKDLVQFRRREQMSWLGRMLARWFIGVNAAQENQETVGIDLHPCRTATRIVGDAPLPK